MMSDKKTEKIDQDTHTQDAQDEGVIIEVQGSEDLPGDELTPGRTLKADDLEDAAEDVEPKEKPEEKPPEEKVKPKSKPKPKTVTVYYYGIAKMGTENPRRMWRYGDSMKVSPEVAKELLNRKLYFTKRRRKK